MSGIVGKLFARIFRLRYILVGAGAGGAYTANKKYDEFKSSLPDFGYIKKYVPAEEQVTRTFNALKDNLRKLSDITLERAASESTTLTSSDKDIESVANGASAATKDTVVKPPPDPQPSLEELRQELLKAKLEYQKELDGMKNENKDLRRQLLLKYQKSPQRDRIKKTLIDLYSEVLDELADMDTKYNVQDQLPRVVVVGDQSSGKTSVLEMIAQARIFPRGSGQMMTRSPVKVTLSEGPYHVASFRDSPQEYDLTKETDLAALRKEIELRMTSLVSNGATISSEVISLSVKGPGLHRIVLIDLPGIISTQTAGMQSGTRESIRNLAEYYMKNPNAIILCVQDGSIDAERSNVTDLVSSVDPAGKRTLFVLTKVDLAEETLYNPNRIKQILEGQLFPMKALGYFAVVTGKGSKDESIESIKEYEAAFFRRSRLFREGALRLTQMTTENLSKAVSERFWRMVKDSVEQQADTYRAIRYNLETEWKNTFPHLREMDRDELFDKARNETLDELATLSAVTAGTWEKKLRLLLWDRLEDFVFEKILEPALQKTSLGTYQTHVDVQLRNWAEQALPKACVNVGWMTLYNQLETVAKTSEKSSSYDRIFDRLRETVFQQAKSRHSWHSKALARLRVIQTTTLEDRTVHTKTQWDDAVNFMERAVKSRMKEADRDLEKLQGPGRLKQWTNWKSRSPEENKRVQVLNELRQLISLHEKPEHTLSQDDVTTVRRNLQARKIQVDDAFIRSSYAPLFRQSILARTLSVCGYCRKSFYYYQQGFMHPSSTEADEGESTNDSSSLEVVATKSTQAANTTFAIANSADSQNDFVDCREVVLFARLQRMLDATGNSLRQQITNDEVRRMEQLVKDILNEISEDPLRLNGLLTGKRVQLAEDLKRTRNLQEKLEEFIAALNSNE